MIEKLKAELYKMRCQQDGCMRAYKEKYGTDEIRNGGYADYYKGYMCAISIIEGILAGMDEDAWRDPNEDPPEELKNVLVWYECMHWSVEQVLPEYGIGHKYEDIWSGDPGSGAQVKVIAWQPLPDPPKKRRPNGKGDKAIGRREGDGAGDLGQEPPRSH